MKDSHPLAIGIDIGATKIAAALLDRNGRTLATRLAPTRSAEGERAIFDRIAGDLGHLSLDPYGLPCTCGLQGCVETILSGPGLVNCARRYLDEGCLPTRLNAGDELTPASIVEDARAGDPLALAAIDEVGRCLGVLLAICVTSLNPAMIVIGGGLGLAAFDYLAPPARAELARRALRQRWQNTAIVPSQVANSAAGAACLVWYKGLE